METSQTLRAPANVNPARRFEQIQAELEQSLLKLQLSLTDPNEKEIYNYVSNAIERANSLAISAQDYFNSRA